MTLFIDEEYPMGTFDQITTNESQHWRREVSLIAQTKNLYNKGEDKVFCIKDTCNKEAVEKHHNKAGLKCESITEVKNTA
jgi:hypothetical protein